jgi:phytoene/squalene synthetase
MRVNRPALEKAVAQLGVYAEGADDPAIDQFKRAAREFCDAVSNKDCFIDDLENCNRNMTEELVRDIKSWRDQVWEYCNRLAPLVGQISARVEKAHHLCQISSKKFGQNNSQSDTRKQI